MRTPHTILSRTLAAGVLICAFTLSTGPAEAVTAFDVRTASDEDMLDRLEEKAVDYFLNASYPATGLIKDRANNSGQDRCAMASIAACGFGLAAFCIGAERGYLTRAEALKRTEAMVDFFHDRAEQEHGFFYHFLDMRTGKRMGKSEVSSIDTGILLAGMIVAAEYFKGTPVAEKIREIYRRVDWQWMLNKGTTLSHGWTPENGFINARWGGYAEHMMLYILGIGSPTYPLASSSWFEWERPVYTYEGYTYLQCPFLFTHQYSQLFFDFRHKHDGRANYFENSAVAIKAHKRFCNNLFRDYHETLWGVSPCDGPGGYMVWGGPPAAGNNRIDGTISPPVMAASLPFVPELVLPALRYLLETYPTLWGAYGFPDAFNPRSGWVARDCIGIDTGAMLLAIENYRSGFVWRYFMQSPYVQYAEQAIGFQRTNEPEHVITFSQAHFMPGRDDRWLSSSYDDSAWEMMPVPSLWEQQGHPAYDGFATYRFHFTLSAPLQEAWEKDWIVFSAGAIDDADEVYLNGQRIGGMGSFTAGHQETAWENDRVYSVPPRVINYEGDNVITVLVYDHGNMGGIWKGPVEIGPLAELDYRPFKIQPQTKLLQDLSELDWSFRTGDDEEWSDPEYTEDDNWQPIQVPYSWEDQGFEEYDGYGWYRCQVFFPREWEGAQKYLLFGGIDDVDAVYLNGEPVGTSGHFPPHYVTAWDKKRLYKIPEGVIQYDTYNCLSIRVYDYMKEGGVRIGPAEIRRDAEH